MTNRRWTNLAVPFWLLLLGLLFAGSLVGRTATAQSTSPTEDTNKDRTVLVSPAQASAERLRAWQDRGYQIALRVDQADEPTIEAARRIKEQAGTVDYFFEVARNPDLAREHPEWMASIQGHHEWMREFKDFPKPKSGEVVKVHPWVPVLNREALDAHVARIEKLLKSLPSPRRIWLNDIQGAPSACGCGHPLCRWTTDYGPIRTATLIGDAAPAEFVERIKKIAESSNVVPIMTSECEQEDQHTVCGGVGCFEGICWKAFSRQLDQVAEKSQFIGVACFYKAYQRDLDRYRQKAGWVGVAIESFGKMPPLRGGKGVPPDRLMAVLQGWNVTAEEIQQQIEVAERLRPAGILVCLAEVDQSWKPLTVKLQDIQKAK